jgi:hypothetical protein
MQARPTNPRRASSTVDSRKASRSRKLVDTGAIGGLMPAAVEARTTCERA